MFGADVVVRFRQGGVGDGEDVRGEVKTEVVFFAGDEHGVFMPHDVVAFSDDGGFGVAFMVVEFGAEVFFFFGERDSGEFFKDVCEFYAALVDVVAEAVGNGKAVLSDVAVEGLHGLPGVAVPLEVGLVPVLFVEEDLVHGLRF